MTKATGPQITKIHVLLHQLNIFDQKEELVSRFSNRRTTSSKELSIEEARDLISALAKYDPCNPVRRKIFSMAYDAGIIWGESSEDKKINAVVLNNFLLKQGAVKKELNKMNIKELQKVVTQLVQIIKRKEENKAAKLTSDLLEELSIESSFKTRQMQPK
jgi:hypothetical protein